MTDELDIFSSFDFGFNADADEPAPEQKVKERVPETDESGTRTNGRQHRKTELYELTPKYEYRRAFSETKLLDALAAPGFHFEEGHCYNFISAGDVDSLSYLKAVLRQQPLDYCLASTWCMGAEDILQFREWVESGKIRKLDIYVGEIFHGSYGAEFRMLKRLYRDHPDLGRFALFRNHSKVFAGTGPLFSFGIQSSANINTNPRTENTCIIIDRGLFEFYKQYYDGIISFE